MTAKELRASILDLAIRGKLVPQDPNDEPAENLLARIAAEKAKFVKSGKLKKDKPLPPITDDDKPFDLPRAWAWCRLGEVIVDMEAGKSPLCEKVPRQGDEWGVIKTTAIQDGYFLPSENKRLPRGFEIHDGYIVRKGDLLITRAGPQNRTGISCVVDVEPKNLILSDKTVRIVYGKNDICPDYLVVMLRSAVIRQSLLGAASGMADSQVNVSQDKIKNLVVPLPPLAEQKRIVEKIEQLMPLVERYGQAEEKRRQLITALPEALKKSILKSAVEGKLVPQDPNDEPAEKLLARIAAEKAKLIKSGKLKKEKPLPPITEDEKPFALPHGWAWCRFGDIVQTVTGKTPPRAENEWWRNDVPWVAIADMKDGCVLTQTKEGVSRKAVETIFQRRVSAAGTLLMSFKLTIGKVAILGLDAVHNEAIISIYPYLDVDHCMRNYLFRILPFVVGWGKSKDAIKGSTLNATSLANLLIPLPPLVEQKRIVARVEELFGMVAAIK